MINHTRSLTLYLLCLSVFINGMEPKQFPQAKPNTHPLMLARDAIYGIKPFPQDVLAAGSLALIKDHIVIGHSGGCFAINLDTKEKVKELCKGKTHKITPHPNKTQLAYCAMPKIYLYDSTVMVYDVQDIQKPTLIWSYGVETRVPYSVAFSTIDDTIFLCQNGVLVDNKKNRYVLPEYLKQSRAKITCHPTKNEIIYPSTNLTLSALQLHADGSTPTIKKYPPLKLENLINEVSYNPQGTACVLLNYKTKEVHLYDLENNECLASYYGCDNIGWHPNGFILALLSNAGINYVNTHTLNVVTQPHIEPIADDTTNNMKRHTLDISYDGKIIAAIRNGKYKIYDIPFETITNDIYPLGTHEKLFTIFHLIKNYNTPLPDEVLSPLMKFLLGLHEYSTNQSRQPA